jgi:hypothetical protein
LTSDGKQVVPGTLDQDSNKLWLIVRYMTIDNRTNEFRLTGGETLKLGRVKFIVREISTSQDDENQTDFEDSRENANNQQILDSGREINLA